MKPFKKLGAFFKSLKKKKDPPLENIIDPFILPDTRARAVNKPLPPTPGRPASASSESSNYLDGFLDQYHAEEYPEAGPSAKPNEPPKNVNQEFKSQFSFDSTTSGSSSGSSGKTSSSGEAVNLSHFPAVPVTSAGSLPPLPGPPPTTPLPPIPGPTTTLPPLPGPPPTTPLPPIPGHATTLPPLPGPPPTTPLPPIPGPRKGKVTTGVRKATKPLKKLPGGLLQVTKVEFETKYDVCSDVVQDTADYKRFYILKDGGYYHWLLERKDPRDLVKPEYLPITINSGEKLSCKVTFKVEENKTLAAVPKIRITMPGESRYEFPVKSGNTSGEFELKFSSSNLPFENQVAHIEFLELRFEYSVPGSHGYEWAGTSTNELYVTWKQPIAKIFWTINFKFPNQDMHIRCSQTAGKLYIPETVLFIGCENAKGYGAVHPEKEDNEYDIIRALFTAFTSLRVYRRRDRGYDMGYWRGSSALGSRMAFRGLRYLLMYGEARCGEWQEFLSCIIFVQGIDSVADFAIVTEMNTINYAPIVTYGSLKYVGGIQVTGIENTLITSSKPAQSGRAIVYGANSYQYPTTPIPKGVLKYDTYRACVFLVKEWRIADPEQPVPLEAKAQGNDMALSFFWDHVFMEYQKDGKKLYFDASYGLSSDISFSDDRELISSYSIRALSGVLTAAMTPESENNRNKKMCDNVNSGLFINLFESSTSQTPNAVPGYNYLTVVDQEMANHIRRT